MIGSPLTTIPEGSLLNIATNKLDLYQRRQRLTEEFWKRFISEYLHFIQKRWKWKEESRNLKVGDLCLLVEITAPSNLWPMARIVKVHPGEDGRVRVVSVKWKDIIVKRGVSKICPLPTCDVEEEFVFDKIDKKEAKE